MIIGLISDTHMPQRWKKLPESLKEIFVDVNLILHAGDIGQLWVLDELSRIAPVVAVHGNDETDEATRALPYHQVLGVRGKRIFLSHCHYPDQAEEMEKRKNDSWQPKLDFRAALGKAHGADIVIFGHTHVPMSLHYEGVWLINPGAIASAGYHVRQTLQSVARLYLEESPRVEHIRLTPTPEIFIPQVNFETGFQAAWQQTNEFMVEPALLAQWRWLFDEIYPLAPENLLAILAELGHRVWTEGQAEISLQEFLQAVEQSDVLPMPLKEKVSQKLGFNLSSD